MSEDTHEFLTTCIKRLHTLGLVESREADFIAYHLDGITKQWWHTFIETRLAESPPVTWTEFFEAFLARFIPHSVRDHLIN